MIVCFLRKHYRRSILTRSPWFQLESPRRYFCITLCRWKIAGSRNYYEILGVTPRCSKKEIRAAYLELCKKYHPDVLVKEDTDDNDSTAIAKKAANNARFQAINEAYDCLSQESKRSHYDSMLRPGYNSNPYYRQPYYHSTSTSRQQQREQQYYDAYRQQQQQQQARYQREYWEYYRHRRSTRRPRHPDSQDDVIFKIIGPSTIAFIIVSFVIVTILQVI
mgnify:CR=1 FL=1